MEQYEIAVCMSKIVKYWQFHIVQHNIYFCEVMFKAPTGVNYFYKQEMIYIYIYAYLYSILIYTYNFIIDT